MQNGIWKLRPAVFALTLICFFLPFLTLSVGDIGITYFSGVQMVAGATIPQSLMSLRFDPEPWAIATLACVVIGLALSFLRSKRGTVGSAVLAGLTVIFLFALKSDIGSEVLQEGGGLVQVEFGVGSYLVIISMLAAIGTSVFVLLQDGDFTQSTYKSPDDFSVLQGVRSGIGMAEANMPVFLDKVKQGLGKGVTSVITKSKETLESTKIKLHLGELERRKIDVLKELGDVAYAMFQKNAFDEERLKAKCAGILELENQITEKQKELNEVHGRSREALGKPKPIDVCTCGAELYEGAKFCKECGVKVEQPTEAPGG